MITAKDTFELEKALLKLESLYASFDYLKINVASPAKIKSWSSRVRPNGEVIGEVPTSGSFDYVKASEGRGLDPVPDGLFSQKIFGPMKDWTCACRKYKGIVPGIVEPKFCEICDVEITEARVRRYRMGYIELGYPIAHYWYLNGRPSYLLLMLRHWDATLRRDELEEILYFKERSDASLEKKPDNLLLNQFGHLFLDHFPESEHDVLDFLYDDDIEVDKNDESKDQTNLETIISNGSCIKSFPGKDLGFLIQKVDEKVFCPANERTKAKHSAKEMAETLLELRLESTGSRRKIRKRIAGEVLKAALESIDIDEAIMSARNTPQKAASLIKTIRILESFKATKTNPAWMMLTTLPVLPPTLRPLIELEDGTLAMSDVNEFYRLIINRKDELNYLLTNFGRSIEILLCQVILGLQTTVDQLIDNARVDKPLKHETHDLPLKSLTEVLEGKEGRFRQTLLGKRTDYSGRSVIVVGPTLKLNECGLPARMAVDLFNPLLINGLFKVLKTKFEGIPIAYSIQLANELIKYHNPFILEILKPLIKNRCILLNRAPTLHKFGVQAFFPRIIKELTIKLHPLVCTGFNADFDGDQMAVHIPIYDASQLEAKSMMLPYFNVLTPANGEVILKPTQDIVIGCYYLTLMIKKSGNLLQNIFPNENEVFAAFYQKKLNIHTPILVKYSSLNCKLVFLDNKLVFSDIITPLNTKEIVLYKVFYPEKRKEKCYLMTSIGILVASKNENTTYQVTDLFLETTPGRLIFSKNYKNAIEEHDNYEHNN